MADREVVGERIVSVEVQEPTDDHEGRIIVDLEDGRRISVPISWSWRLEDAEPGERQNTEISPSRHLIRWPDVDEDLSVSGLLRGGPALPPQDVDEKELAREAWPPGRIKRLRDDMCLTQAEFANRIGVRQATISDWERGKAEPQPMAMQLLDRIASKVYGEGEADEIDTASESGDASIRGQYDKLIERKSL